MWYPEDYSSLFANGKLNTANYPTYYSTYNHFAGEPSVMYKGTQVVNNSSGMTTSPIQNKGTPVPRFSYKGYDILHRLQFTWWNQSNKIVRGTIGPYKLSPWENVSGGSQPSQSYYSYPYVNWYFDTTDGDPHWFYDEVSYNSTSGDTSFSSCSSWVWDFRYLNTSNSYGWNEAYNGQKMSIDLRLQPVYTNWYNYTGPADSLSSRKPADGAMKLSIFRIDMWEDNVLSSLGNVNPRLFGITSTRFTELTARKAAQDYMNRYSSCSTPGIRGNWNSTGYMYLFIVQYATSDDTGIYDPNDHRQIAQFSFMVYSQGSSFSVARGTNAFNAMRNCILNDTWTREDGKYDWYVMAEAMVHAMAWATYENYNIYPTVRLVPTLQYSSVGGRAYVKANLVSSGSINQLTESLTNVNTTYYGSGTYYGGYTTDGVGMNHRNYDYTANIKLSGGTNLKGFVSGVDPETNKDIYDKWGMSRSWYNYSSGGISSVFSFAGIHHYESSDTDWDSWDIPNLAGRGIDESYITDPTDYIQAVQDFMYSSCTFEINDSWEEYIDIGFREQSGSGCEKYWLANFTSCFGTDFVNSTYYNGNTTRLHVWLCPKIKFINFPLIDIIPQYSQYHITDVLY